MTETIYISSTYLDLKNFRQAIIDCVVSLGEYYKPVSMEFYEAEDTHFVKRCLDDVAACNIYILILGKRYGYTPPGCSKSITELEYDKARECQKNGRQMEILVFKVGDICNTYNYKENDPDFKEYQEDFLGKINEQSSPKPFNSEAELALQVAYSLMKRLFKLFKTGGKIIPPDKDVVLCYFYRKAQINKLNINVLKKKRICFIHGKRETDYPAGIVKRFANYSLGSSRKIEPFIKITDMIASNDFESNRESCMVSMLDYLNCSITAFNCSSLLSSAVLNPTPERLRRMSKNIL